MNSTLLTFCAATLAAGAALAPVMGGAQETAVSSNVAMPEVPAQLPFGVGEVLDYEVRFGAIRVGSGRMEVAGSTQLRGRNVLHTVFSIRGGTVFYRVDDKYESWFDSRTMTSLRHLQDIDQGSRERVRRFEIFPERGVYTENEGEERPTVQNPLDDGTFLYFIRTVPLEVGRTYEFNRYFRPDRNPVTIRVLRKETVRVPAGTFETVVIQPIIKSRGIFSDRGRAEIWITDDDRRMMVQMKSRLSVGSLNLFLRSHTPAPATTR